MRREGIVLKGDLVLFQLIPQGLHVHLHLLVSLDAGPESVSEIARAVRGQLEAFKLHLLHRFLHGKGIRQFSDERQCHVQIFRRRIVSSDPCFFQVVHGVDQCLAHFLVRHDRDKKSHDSSSVSAGIVHHIPF